MSEGESHRPHEHDPAPPMKENLPSKVLNQQKMGAKLARPPRGKSHVAMWGTHKQPTPACLAFLKDPRLGGGPPAGKKDRHVRIGRSGRLGLEGAGLGLDDENQNYLKHFTFSTFDGCNYVKAGSMGYENMCPSNQFGFPVSGLFLKQK